MNEWINAFIEEMTQYFSRETNEEIATQFQSKADEYLRENPL